MAFQFVPGQLLQPAPQLENIVATRPATESTPQSTRDAAAASSPDIPEETEDFTTHLPTNPPNSPSSASDEDAGSPLSSSEEGELSDTLPIGEQMDEGMRQACHTYRKHQKAFEAFLCSIGVQVNDRPEYLSLLDDQGTTIAPHNYERVAQLIRRAHGLHRHKRMKGTLFRIIRGREVVQSWHLRLHDDDARHAKDADHQDMIDVLKRTYAILTSGTAYLKKAKRKGRGKSQAAQAAQRQLPVPAAPRQLPLPAFQPMRADDPG
jgi:hypothetical protein